MKKNILTIILCAVVCMTTLISCGKTKIKELTDADIKTYTSKMSGECLSGDMTLNGVKMTLPVEVQTFLDNGFKFNDFDYKSEKLEDGYYVDGVLMDDGKKGEDTRISVTIFNTSGKSVKLEEAKIGTIKLYKNDDSYKNNIVLPKGITLKSTYDDVINAYGKPKVDAFKQAGFIKYYITDIGKYGQNLQIYFDKNTKVIKSIELQNIPRED